MNAMEQIWAIMEADWQYFSSFCVFDDKEEHYFTQSTPTIHGMEPTSIVYGKGRASEGG